MIFLTSQSNTFWKTHTPFILFWLSALMVGLSIFRDYGLSHDEVSQRTSGAMSAVYINQQLGYMFLSEASIRQKAAAIVYDSASIDKYLRPDGLLMHRDRDYGVFFELLLIGIEVATGLDDSAEVFQARHLANHICFLLGVLLMYGILYEWKRKWEWALLGSVFLWLSPVVFAHSFFNSKDIPFMVAYLASIYTLIRFLREKSWQTALLHALACAIAIDIRIPGVFMIVLTGLMLALEIAKSPGGWLPAMRAALPNGLLYGVACCALIVLFWPFLWESPLQNFIFSFNNMSKFRWKGETFAMGQIFEPYLYTPWYYIGSWIFVNTPLLYIVSFLIGLGVAVSRLFRRTLGSWLYKTADERTEVLLIGASLMPIVAVVVLSSTIYDGWRQLYFTYPGMLLLATGMLMRLFAQPMPQQSFGKWLKVGLLGAIALTLAHTGYRMIRLHPYQNVYFNVLAGSRPDQLFDMDYWGVSYRQLLQDLSQQSDIQRPIKVWGKEFSAKINLKMLPVEQRGQFVFVDSLEQADYYLTIFRDRLPNGEYVFPDTLIDRKQPAVEVRTADGIALSAAFKVVR